MPVTRASRIAIAVAACAAAVVPVATASAASPLLFSVTAGGSVVARAGTGHTITLPASSNLAWFTDRPARRAGTGTVGGLVDGWTANHFDTSAPNAAFVMTRRSVTRQVVVTLTSARRAGANVVFGARLRPRASVMGMRTADPLRPGRYGRTEVFIDDGDVPPCGYQHASFGPPVDCILGPGDGYVEFGSPTRFANGVSVTVTGADGTPVTVIHRWFSWQFPGSCPGTDLCADTASTTQVLATPFAAAVAPAPAGVLDEAVRVIAPDTPAGTLVRTVVRVQMSPR